MVLARSSLNNPPHNRTVKPDGVASRLVRNRTAKPDLVPTRLPRLRTQETAGTTDSRASATSKGKPKFSKKDEWKTISAMLVRQFKLPHGSSFKIVITNKKHPEGRVQRDNTGYWRTPFSVARMGMPDDDCSLTDLVAEFIVPYIDLDLKALRAKIECFGPDGKALTARKVGTWRSLQSALTDEQLQALDDREAEEDELTREAVRMIHSLAEARWDPEEIVPTALMRAGAEEYGLEAMQAALDAVKKGKRRR